MRPLATGQELTFPARAEECGHGVRSKLRPWSSFTHVRGTPGPRWQGASFPSAANTSTAIPPPPPSITPNRGLQLLLTRFIMSHTAGIGAWHPVCLEQGLTLNSFAFLLFSPVRGAEIRHGAVTIYEGWVADLNSKASSMAVDMTRARQKDPH